MAPTAAFELLAGLTINETATDSPAFTDLELDRRQWTTACREPGVAPGSRSRRGGPRCPTGDVYFRGVSQGPVGGPLGCGDGSLSPQPDRNQYTQRHRDTDARPRAISLAPAPSPSPRPATLLRRRQPPTRPAHQPPKPHPTSHPARHGASSKRSRSRCRATTCARRSTSDATRATV